MRVRAKMKCTNIMPNTADATTGRVVLEAVCDEQNKTWAKYTPCGKVEMSIDNPPAFAAFKSGEHYFVDFAPAAATEAGEGEGA